MIARSERSTRRICLSIGYRSIKWTS